MLSRPIGLTTSIVEPASTRPTVWPHHPSVSAPSPSTHLRHPVITHKLPGTPSRPRSRSGEPDHRRLRLRPTFGSTAGDPCPYTPTPSLPPQLPYALNTPARRLRGLRRRSYDTTGRAPVLRLCPGSHDLTCCLADHPSRLHQSVEPTPYYSTSNETPVLVAETAFSLLTGQWRSPPLAPHA